MKGTRAHLAASFVIVASLMALAPSVTLAEERTCRGTIGPSTLDDVRVPDGATCRLNGTRVEGTVQVETGAILKAYDVRVIGNVVGEDSRKVVVADGSRVGGRIAGRPERRRAGRRQPHQRRHPHRREPAPEQDHRQRRGWRRPGVPEHRWRGDPFESASTATSSARRTALALSGVATWSRATRKTSARACEATRGAAVPGRASPTIRASSTARRPLTAARAIAEQIRGPTSGPDGDRAQLRSTPRGRRIAIDTSHQG